MGRMVDPKLLVGSAEIADRLGAMNNQVIHVWRRRDPSFPDPVKKLRRALIWYWPDVEKWAKKTGRL